MSKSKRTQKKVAAMAANVSEEQREIEAAVEQEIAAAPVKRTIVLPEGVTGAQRRVVLPQTSEKAAKLIPALQTKVDEAKEAAKKDIKEASGIVAKAKAAKAEKTGKVAKTATTKSVKGVGKYENNITSMEKLGDWCLTQKFTPEEVEKVFVAGYALKGVTDMNFIKPRIAIYMNIARKRNLKLNPAAEVAEAKKEEVAAPEKTVRKVIVAKK